MTSHGTEPDPQHDLNDGPSHHHFPEVPHPPPRFQDNPNDEHSTDVPPPPQPPSYHSTSYPTNDDLPPPTSRSDTPYPQHYSHHQPYLQDPSQQHIPPQNYPFHEPSPYSYPNFQSYPSFTESSLPSTPSHYPSHYQNTETYHSTHSAPALPSSTSFSSAPPYSSSSNGWNSNAAVADPVPSQAAKKYQYDSSYQPPPEKVAEAHKAARFAVGALAFDDVSVAVDYLKKSLELLTNPSAS